jgi:hypothetical protein
MQLNDEQLFFAGAALTDATLAVMYRQLERANSALWRSYGPYILALALPLSFWVHGCWTADPGHSESFYGWAVIILWPTAMSLAPLLLARSAMRYRNAVYYPLVIALTPFAWLSATCFVWGTMPS